MQKNNIVITFKISTLGAAERGIRNNQHKETETCIPAWLRRASERRAAEIKKCALTE